MNTRAAYYFILALVSPRDMPGREAARPTLARGHQPGAGTPRRPVAVGPPAAGAAEAPEAGRPRRTLPASGRPPSPTGAAGELAPTAVPSGAPARIGATIGALERLLIVTFVLVNAIAAVGFVIAAKTLARFKQLDDRGFAEYYLLGTLASASVAIGSALVAQAALATIP